MRFGAFARLSGSDCRYFAQPVFIWKFTYLVLLIPKFVLSPFDFSLGLFFDPSPRLLRGERICPPTHVVAPSVRDPAFRFPPRASPVYPHCPPASHSASICRNYSYLEPLREPRYRVALFHPTICVSNKFLSTLQQGFRPT